jgi:hypothetical protein
MLQVVADTIAETGQNKRSQVISLKKEQKLLR